MERLFPALTRKRYEISHCSERWCDRSDPRFASHFASSCADAGDMNAQARTEFERADADLNKTYQALLAKLRDTESKHKLREEQRAWVGSRDAEAARAAKEADGGSMAPTLRYDDASDPRAHQGAEQ